MLELGLLLYFLGLEVHQSEDGIFISQKKYVVNLVKNVNMLNCKPMPTPMNVNEKLMVDDGVNMVDVKQFRSMVGGLNYLSHTRPDITFSISVISRFMHSLTIHHLGSAKRILIYVAGSLDFGVLYMKVSDFKWYGFSNSDWAGCLDDRRSRCSCFVLIRSRICCC